MLILIHKFDLKIEKSHKKHKKSKHHSKENDGSNLNNNNCSDSLTSIDSAKPKTTKSLQTKFRSTGIALVLPHYKCLCISVH